MALVALVLMPIRAWGALGKVISVSVSPSPVPEGIAVTVTVKGTGSCYDVDLDFGDNAPHVALWGPFPLKSKPHTYKTWGTVTLRAKAYKPPKYHNFTCEGQASASLKVTPRFSGKVYPGGQATLCAVTSDSAPTITGAFWVGRPGGAGFVTGTCFGPPSPYSQLQLTLRRFSDGQPFQVNIIVSQWRDDLIQGVIPDASVVFGVLDQDATLRVFRADGRTSNGWTVTSFRAAQDLQIVPAGNMQIYCAQAATWNACDGIGTLGWCHVIYPGEGLSGYGTLGTLCGGGTCGFHDEDCLATGDTDTDSYTVRLKNGWTFSSVSFTKWESSGWVHDPTVTGSSDSFIVSVRWHTDSDGGPVSYDLAILIFGPVGVPAF